ncbi:MAG: hypothetical protein ACRC7S_14065 [Cetobacterium sp.]
MKNKKDIIITLMSLTILILIITIANLEHKIELVNDNMDTLRNEYIEVYDKVYGEE